MTIAEFALVIILQNMGVDFEMFLVHLIFVCVIFVFTIGLNLPGKST